MIKNVENSKMKYLTAKKIIWIPLTAALLLIGSFIGIYNFVKATSKKYLYIFIGIIILFITVNFIYLLYRQIKTLNEKLKEVTKDKDSIKINRDALINQLQEKDTKLNEQQNNSYFLKCLFIDFVRTQDDAKKYELINQFFEFERKIRL